MSKAQIGILVGLALLATSVLCALGYIMLRNKAVQPISDKAAQIAKLIALYDDGHGSFDKLCSITVSIGRGNTLPPEPNSASYYAPSRKDRIAYAKAQRQA